MVLQRSVTEPTTLYTPDKLFRVSRCDVWAYGWTVSIRQDDGSYRPEAIVRSIREAGRMISISGR